MNYFEEIKKHRQPFIGVSTSKQKNFPVKHLWTKESWNNNKTK